MKETPLRWVKEQSKETGTVPDNETILYRGASFELGHGPGYYGIWPAGTPRPPSIEWWPDTPEGWQGAWARYNALETPGTIVMTGQRPAVGPPAGGVPARGGRPGRRGLIAAALLAAGVVCGLAGLFPAYLSGASLAQQPAELIPHVLYLAAWAASAALILSGGTRRTAGALLGAGTSIVTFGLFFADAGQVIAGGAHVLGAGLVLSLIGWLACTAGSVTALAYRPARPDWRARRTVLGLALAVAAALGTAITFAPSWDSYIFRTPAGVAHSLTAGNAFASPGPVIAGNVAVMVALVLVAAVAALWRPARLGAVLLAGAVIPMAAQAISALVQAGEAVSPTQFGISSAQASASGLTISPGLTAVFWVYCVFVVALAVACGWLFLSSRRAAVAAPPPPPPAARTAAEVSTYG
jgi:hypothetical protein